MLQIVTILFLCFYTIFVQAQNLEKVFHFPEILNENSGMVVIDSNQIWLHNDGGNAPYLYQLNAKGEIQKKVRISNNSNKDWEDICTDGNQFFYLGDFGNNRNNRKDLKILKIPYLPDFKDTIVEAEFINFSYPEQQDFPPEDDALHYDMEAMIHYEDALYLFTKNRTKPYSAYTYLYKVPVDTGRHEAVLLDSFDTGQRHWFYSVTGAAVSPQKDKIALLAGNKLWVFSDFEKDQFFKGTVKTYAFRHSQKEAVDFVNNDVLYLSDEKSILGSARLYRYNTRPSKKASLVLSNVETKLPKIGDTEITLQFDANKQNKVSYKISCLSNFFDKKVKTDKTSIGNNRVTLCLPEEMEQKESFIYQVVIDPKGGDIQTVEFRFQK